MALDGLDVKFKLCPSRNPAVMQPRVYKKKQNFTGSVVHSWWSMVVMDEFKLIFSKETIILEKGKLCNKKGK